MTTPPSPGSWQAANPHLTNPTPPQIDTAQRHQEALSDFYGPARGKLPWNWPLSELGKPLPRRVKRVIWAGLLVVFVLFVLGFVIPLVLYSR